MRSDVNKATILDLQSKNQDRMTASCPRLNPPDLLDGSRFHCGGIAALRYCFETKLAAADLNS